MDAQREEFTKLINNNIKELIDQIVNNLQFQQHKKEVVNASLSSLVDIKRIYLLSMEQLYKQILGKVSQINQTKPLFAFEIETVIEGIFEKIVSQLHIFKEAYEISVLKSEKPQYSHLRVECPLIKINIPKPFISQPLAVARFVGEARTFSFDEGQQQ